MCVCVGVCLSVFVRARVRAFECDHTSLLFSLVLR